LLPFDGFVPTAGFAGGLVVGVRLVLPAGFSAWAAGLAAGLAGTDWVRVVARVAVLAGSGFAAGFAGSAFTAGF
jgi:hypothetical protein